MKTGLHDRRRVHAHSTSGTRHRADDRLNQQSAALHDSGEAQSPLPAAAGRSAGGRGRIGRVNTLGGSGAGGS